MGDYRFCAQVHYIFGCGEGETVHEVLRRLGLAEAVTFHRLDPEGFDHVVVAGERYRIPNGLEKFRDRMIRRCPEATTPLRGYFRIVGHGDRRELDLEGCLPRSRGASGRLRPAALRRRHLVRYARSTLADVYDAVAMPPVLRAVLAGQSGDYLLPPEEVSFLLHVALVAGYDRGAYYPRHHYGHFVEALADVVRSGPGSALLLGRTVSAIHVAGDRVVGVSTSAGERFTASRYLSNVDPRRTQGLLSPPPAAPAPRGLRDYAYSHSTITMYLAVRGLDLRDHGFGSFNLWHYPHADLARMYRDQVERRDLSNPWLFLSTPSLHSDLPGICPPGHQLLEVATVCDQAHFLALRQRDRRAYNKEKQRLREHLLDLIEATYVPGLRDHLELRVLGTPATNARFCGAPAGNAYGAALTPAQVGLGRVPAETPWSNLWLANATAGYPSVAGTVRAGFDLYQRLARR
jgi:all-trans-retinol 13,14-reductase